MGRSLPAGTDIGQYVVVRELGAGGFGITYLARDRQLDKTVAIKEFFPEDLVTRAASGDVVPLATRAGTETKFAEGRKLFLTEARTLARVDHPNIVRVIAFLEARGTAYIVMDFIDGVSLADTIERGGPFTTEAQLLRILLPLMDAIEAVHAVNIIHRDLKPENILIRRNGTPVLIDFGTVHSVESDAGKTLNPVLTPGYAPLEQYSSSARQGPWTDIYSLAAVAYSCLTASAPPDASDRVPNDPLLPLGGGIKARLSRAVLDALEWGLAPYAGDRPQTVAQWRAVLQGKARRPGASGLMQPALLRRNSRPRPQIATVPETVEASGRRRGPLLAFIAIAVVAVGGIVYVLAGSHATKPADGSGTAAPAGVDSSDGEAQDFSKAQKIDTPEAYALYVRLHPNGRNRAAADAKRNGIP